MSAAPESPASDVFSRRVRSVVIALSVLSLLGTVIAVVFGARLTAPPAHATDSYSRGPLGHRAFIDTLGALGFSVTRWNEPGLIEVETPLVIVEPERLLADLEGQRIDFAALLAARVAAGRPTILVLPKWLPSVFAPQMVEPGGHIPARLYEEALTAALTTTGGPLGVTHPEDDLPHTLEVHDERGEVRTVELQAAQRITWGRPLVSDASGSFVALDASGLVMLVADPDLVHNATFHHQDNVGVVIEAIERTFPGRALAFAEPFHGEIVRPSLASFLSEWPGLLFLIHLGALALAVLLASRKRFGPPRLVARPYGHGPQEIIDVAASVLVSGTRLSRLSEEFVEHTITDTHRALDLSPAPTVIERARALDEAAQRRGIAAQAVTLLGSANALPARSFVRAADAFTVARAAARLRRQLLSSRKDAR